MRLRSLSNSITVDLMATEKIEDTENLTRDAIDDVLFNCVSYNDSFKLTGGISLFARSGGKKKK